MNLLLLRDGIPWFGRHTGYEQLSGHLPGTHQVAVVAPRSGQLVRYLGSGSARLRGRMGRGATDFSELEFYVRRGLGRPAASHILYLEQHLELLKFWTKAPKNLFGTIHLPPSVWRPEQCQQLSRLNSAVVLYQKDISFYEKHTGKNRVKFIHHGAATDFFKPGPSGPQPPPRILYSGVYLRNEPMLVRVINRLTEKNREVRFDLLVPNHHRSTAALTPLRNHPAVTWHAGLNDEGLRALYQRAYLMLLPMNDSGANTAVVEALSSGLPIVTTDVGGIRDYGGGSIFPVVPANEDDAMLDLLEQYLAKPAWRDEVGRKCRQFAESQLAWPLVAQKHIQAYEELAA